MEVDLELLNVVGVLLGILDYEQKPVAGILIDRQSLSL
jgi:hypothetical protein